MRQLAAVVFVLGLGAGALVFSPAKAASCPCTIWPSTATPAVANASDTNAVELGVKFQSDTSGMITGIRFYKGNLNTGTHTGSLWNATGTRLASATFTNETASGWQSVDFASPVSINANTTYVASYFAPSGRYSYTSAHFTTAQGSGPLRALSSDESGGNGVYTYGASNFPTSSYNRTNYWVEPIFTEGGSQPGDPDTTAPTVTGNTPLANASNVATSTSVSAVFNEAIDASTVNGSTIQLSQNGTLVPGDVTYTPESRTASLSPGATLATSTVYTATVKGGASGVKDIAGNALAADYTWTFTTAAAPAPPQDNLHQGFGGPVLVVTASDRPFSRYYSEILRAEGINSFTSANLDTISMSTLNQYDTVILGEIALNDTHVSMISDWVSAGGNLIAMRPDKKLNGLLGITDQMATLNEGYLLVDTSRAPGTGIVGQTMQYHGAADRYTANSGTTTAATLYSNATTATSSPAVTIKSVGTNGGHAVAFAYDLAKSVVYTHQGNPAWAGDERDGNSVIRPNDLFFGAKAGDVQPDWVNLDKVAIPQADEQQRLLANIMQHVSEDDTASVPMPKTWYFPKGKKAVVVMTSDDHSTSNGTQTSFERLKSESPAGCVVANWECFRSTSWVYTNIPLTNTQAASYHSQGFDLGVHVNTNCANWTPAQLNQFFQTDLQAFKTKYPSLPQQTGSRTHCIAWSDWASAAKIEKQNGIRIDLNYYYWPGEWVQDRPGFMTGSGIPMRFGDLDGSMIDVYQVPSHLVNESGMSFPSAIHTVLDKALGAEGYYGAFGTHYDFSDTFDQQLIASAKARGVPLVSAQQMLDWTDGRNQSYFSGMAWNGNNLTFTATAHAKTGTMLRGMLPLQSSKGAIIGISQGGTNVSYTIETIKGITYAIFPVTSGNYTVQYGSDTTAPTVLSTVPATNATGVAVTTKPTATFSEAVDPATVTTTNVRLTTGSGQTVTSTISYDAASKVVTLTPVQSLSMNTTYTMTVKGTASGVKDLAGNALASDKVWSFTTTGSLGCPCSLWPGNPTPAVVTIADSNAVELGVKFRSSVAGKITGIRFYKGSQNTGTHSISLWSATGTRLSTATVTNETASGWQSASFATPVNIAANTTYVASYFAPQGHYSASSNYFANAFSNGPLNALASGASGGNGVYAYGATSRFPQSSFNATNYWVDVTFTPN